MHTAKRVLVVVFVVLILLPAMQMVSQAIPLAPLEENRRLARFPKLAEWQHPALYVAELQKWFDEHYGFRALLIRAKTQLDYSLFGASDKLHIGRDGFLFYRSVIDEQEPVIERLSPQDLDRIVANFARIRDTVAAKGIKLIIQSEQLKDKFYPDKLPRDAAFARSRHRFDELRAKLSVLPGVTYFDTTPLLERVKAERPIFHKTDFHWNDPAAFACAEWLVDTIAQMSEKPVPFWRIPLVIEQRRISGGQAMFMPLFQPPVEDALFVKPVWDESFYTHSEPPPFEWRASRVAETGQALLPPVVLYGDSFLDGMMRSGFVMHFSEVSVARYGHVSLETVLDALPQNTKFLIIEFIEVNVIDYINIRLPGNPI